MNIKKLLIVILGLSILCIGGCDGENLDIEQSTSDISVTDDFLNDVTELMNNYFNVLKEHDYQQINQYTTSDYDMNYNQTKFEEFTVYISDCTVDEIDFDYIKKDGNKFTIPVRYTIVYSNNYTADNGSAGGNYSYYDDFIIEKTDNEVYKISASSHKGVG